MPVKLVEANDRFIRVGSEAWEGHADLPVDIRDQNGIRVIAGSGKYRRPTAAIPVDSITAIGVYKQLPRLERVGPRSVLLGMGAGATWGMVLMATVARDDNIADEAALAGTVVAGLAGAVMYPIWRMLRPKHRLRPHDYIIEEAGYRLEIR